MAGNIARDTADKIIWSLRSRGGFDNAFDMCDEQIQTEIHEELQEIIQKALDRK